MKKTRFGFTSSLCLSGSVVRSVFFTNLLEKTHASEHRSRPKLEHHTKRVANQHSILVAVNDFDASSLQSGSESLELVINDERKMIYLGLAVILASFEKADLE